MRAGIKFRAFKDTLHLTDSIELRGAQELGGTAYAVVEMSSCKARHEGDSDYHGAVPAFMTLAPDESQSLMDALYSAGVRPSDGQGSAGMMKAVQAHLKDVQEDKSWLKGVVERLSGRE